MAASYQNQRSNILFLFTDDQHFRALGAAGNREVRTPNMDWIARGGVHFTHCHVSNPICTPSRASVQTGQYGFRNGVTFFNQAIRPEAPRLARILSSRGYQTAFSGKWHNDARPCDHGFYLMRNVFVGGMHNYESIPVVQSADDAPVETHRHPSEVFTDGALELLDNGCEEPFALFVWYTAPHDPRTPPEKYESLYPPERITAPPNFMPEPPFDPGTLDIRDEKLLARPLSLESVKREIGRYYGLITHVDNQIGRLLHHLQETRRLDNTVIFLAGDNGLSLGAHGLLGKQNMYEEAVRVPLIVRGPGFQSGVKCDALVDLMDIMPTMCDIAGALIPSGVQGRTLTPLLTGRRNKLRDSIFCHYDDLFRMVRTQQHKLVHHLKSGREEVFHTETDPYEQNNLIESAVHAPILNDLRGRLAQWRKAVNDPTLGG
jgi:arylsulfatase A-like enzyme